MAKYKTNITGKKFNMLTVIKKIPNTKPIQYLCKCDCGNTTIVSIYNLYNGMVKSCGCLRSSNARKVAISKIHKPKNHKHNNKCRLCRKDKGANRWYCNTCLKRVSTGLHHNYTYAEPLGW